MRRILILTLMATMTIALFGENRGVHKKPAIEGLRDKLDTFALIERFMYAAYPQLKESYQMQLINYLSYKVAPAAPEGVQFTVDQFCKAPLLPTTKGQPVRRPRPCHEFYPDRPLLMLGNFIFTHSGELEQYEGVFTDKERELDQVASKIDYSPTNPTELLPRELRPSDKEIIEQLAKAGAQFTPDNKDAFLRVLKEQKWDQCFGKHRVKSVDFIVRKRDHGEAVLQWLVQLEVYRTHKTYLLLYNSFDGSLRAVLPHSKIEDYDVTNTQP